MAAICEMVTQLASVASTVASAARACGSLLVSYMPLAHCGIKFFHGKARGSGAKFGRARFSCIFCFSEQSLAATDPSSGFKFQFTQATLGESTRVVPQERHQGTIERFARLGTDE